MTQSTVYSITHRESGREYIGVTTQPVKNRWGCHLSSARQPESDSNTNTRMPIVRALREHGEAAFDFGVLAVLPTPEEGRLAERIAIALHRPAFNACSGPIGDFERTRETRLKMSAANRKSWAEGKRPRTATAETRAKMSEARRGRKHGPQTRALIAEANRQRSITDETRARMSASQRLRKHGPMSEETKAKIAAKALARSAARKAARGDGV